MNQIFPPLFISSLCTDRVFSNSIPTPPSISFSQVGHTPLDSIPTPPLWFLSSAQMSCKVGSSQCEALTHNYVISMVVPGVKLRDWEEFEPLWFKLLSSVLLQAKKVHNLMQTLGMGYGSCILMSLCQLGDEWGGVKWKHVATTNNVVKSFAFVITKLFHLFDVVLSNK
jgi:hypothetical protein